MLQSSAIYFEHNEGLCPPRLIRVPLLGGLKGWTAFTSFGLYARESVRALNQGAAPAHIEKLVGVMWSRLSAEDKQGWVSHARCGRGGASQGSKPVRKRPMKRGAVSDADVIGDGDSGNTYQELGLHNMQKFTHHSLRSVRSPRRDAVLLDLTAETTDFPLATWHRKIVQTRHNTSRYVSRSPAELDDLQLEVNTIETLAGMQAAAVASSRI